MKKIPLLIAGAVGYVLGTKAGRGRYEQLKTGAQKVAENPRVQAATHKAQETVTAQAAAAAGAAKDKERGRRQGAARGLRPAGSLSHGAAAGGLRAE